MPRPRPGYSLVEVVLVAGLIALLIGLVLPAVQKAREAANRTACGNNLRQMGLACHNFETAYGFFPASIKDTGPQRSWAVQFLPWIEQGNVARTYDYTRHWCEPQNAAAVGRQIKSFYCPSSPSGYRTAGGGAEIKVTDANGIETVVQYTFGPGACTDYAVIDEVKEDVLHAGLADRTGYGILKEDQFPRVADVTDGTSNTLMIVECGGRPEWWVRGQQVATDNNVDDAPWASRGNDFGLDGFDLADYEAEAGPCAVNCSNSNEVYGFHPGGAQCCFGDGSVRFVNQNVTTRMFGRLVTRNGGETVNPADY
jgi:prepilin-type processing-associated H-X9-DG protein